jgi:hypothetical protein
MRKSNACSHSKSRSMLLEVMAGGERKRAYLAVEVCSATEVGARQDARVERKSGKEFPGRAGFDQQAVGQEEMARPVK